MQEHFHSYKTPTNHSFIKFSYRYIAAALCMFILSCSALINDADKGNVLPATELQPYGRYLFNSGQQLELISSAVHFGFTFEGNEAHVFATVPANGVHGYLQYELDGVYQKRVKIAPNTTEPIVIKAPTEGRHTVWIYKATEAHTGPIMIEKVTGNKIVSVQKPAAPVIEFIGNSITCGAAADPSEVPCNTAAYHDQHNAYMAYGPRLARTLGANFILSSVSGIGIYRNWNSDRPTMPQVYDKIDFQDKNTKRWDFEKFKPQVVSIALGTNDFSLGDGKNERLPFDSASFVNNYIEFVQQVRTIHPGARIALLSSPMLNGNKRTLLENCLSAVKAVVDSRHSAETPIALFFFEPMQARGCTGHPSVEDHAILADQLTPFFNTLLAPHVK